MPPVRRIQRRQWMWNAEVSCSSITQLHILIRTRFRWIPIRLLLSQNGASFGSHQSRSFIAFHIKLCRLNNAQERKFGLVSRRQHIQQPSVPPQSWPPARKAPTGRLGQKRKRDEEDIEMEVSTPSSPVLSASRRSNRAPRSAQKVYVEDSDEDSPDARVIDEDDYDPSNDSQTASKDPLIEMDDDFLDDMCMDAKELQVKSEPEEPVIPPIPAPQTIDEMIEEDFEDKPKMVSLSYSGFEIPGRYLCVIVEPYPPLPKEELNRAPTVEPPNIRFRAPTAVPQLKETNFTPSPLLASDRGGSMTPATRFRSATPLFLPADDEREPTPASTTGPFGKTIPPDPLFNHDSDEDDEPDLLAFSQALANVPRSGGGLDDDEEIEYLRGDADEVRGD